MQFFAQNHESTFHDSQISVTLVCAIISGSVSRDVNRRREARNDNLKESPLAERELRDVLEDKETEGTLPSDLGGAVDRRRTRMKCRTLGCICRTFPHDGRCYLLYLRNGCILKTCFCRKRPTWSGCGQGKWRTRVPMSKGFGLGYGKQSLLK